MGDNEYTYTLPTCKLSEHCYLSVRRPTLEGKTIYTCYDVPTGHSVPCNIFDIERIPYPAIGFAKLIRDNNIERWFT